MEIEENIKIELIDETLSIPSSSPEFSASATFATPLRLQTLSIPSSSTEPLLQVMDCPQVFSFSEGEEESQTEPIRETMESLTKEFKGEEESQTKEFVNDAETIEDKVVEKETETQNSGVADGRVSINSFDSFVISRVSHLSSVCDSTSSTVSITPKLIFIIPYRDRLEQYKFFSKQMKWVLEDINPLDYKIFYIHQDDTREFNRGAMKNIGFILVKKLYPNDYKNITLVFNDIDIMPLSKNFLDYNTTKGTVKHFYGFKFTLGGIVSINAEDFEMINGFPNFWAWGYEDNLLQKRVLEAKINIDRETFYPIFDKNMLLLHDGITRTVNKREFDRYMKQTKEGIYSIHSINYELKDNGFLGEADSQTQPIRETRASTWDTNKFVNVKYFKTETEPLSSHNTIYDLRNGARPFKSSINTIKRKGVMGMIF